MATRILQTRSYASQIPKFPTTTKVDKDDLFDKVSSSKTVMTSITSLIALLESRGLSESREPAPEEWEAWMMDSEVQAALNRISDACDEIGVPLNAQVLAALTKHRQK